MPEEDQPDTQKTPKGYEIPLPKRVDVERDLGKIAPPVKRPAPPEKD